MIIPAVMKTPKAKEAALNNLKDRIAVHVEPMFINMTAFAFSRLKEGIEDGDVSCWYYLDDLITAKHLALEAIDRFDDRAFVALGGTNPKTMAAWLLRLSETTLRRHGAIRFALPLASLDPRRPPGYREGSTASAMRSVRRRRQSAIRYLATKVDEAFNERIGVTSARRRR